MTAAGSGMLRVRLCDPVQRPAAEEMLSRALAVPVYGEPGAAVLSARVDDPQHVPFALAVLGLAGIDIAEFAFGPARTELHDYEIASGIHQVDFQAGGPNCSEERSAGHFLGEAEIA